MTRNVNGKDMAEAFEDALGPRVTRAAEELAMTGGEEALQEFRNFDVYLGAKPILKGGKKSVIARFPQVLAGVRETPGS